MYNEARTYYIIYTTTRDAILYDVLILYKLVDREAYITTTTTNNNVICIVGNAHNIMYFRYRFVSTNVRCVHIIYLHIGTVHCDIVHKMKDSLFSKKNFKFPAITLRGKFNNHLRITRR